jgi:DNA (cytosine-5)-methyltransferase 1
MITVGSLFSGIGGLELGLERTGGFKTVWQVEQNDYARRVLEKHWPGVRRHDDVCTFPIGSPGDWKCDLICGGFPCQDISQAGKGEGIREGTRSGLWHEFARIIFLVQPRFVLVENVGALLGRGMDVVLGTLAEGGYDAEWSCLPASLFGAHHVRERVFILAYPDGFGRLQEPVFAGRDVSQRQGTWPPMPVDRMACTHGVSHLCDPDLSRVADGIPGGVDRLRGLGNAVVPQVAEFIGRRILESIGHAA